MKLRSTNRELSQGDSSLVSFSFALFSGVAADKGLYVPTTLPTISKKQLESWKNLSYAELASEIISLFLQDDVPKEKITSITKEAYPFSVPLEKLDENTTIAWLDQGPTASFKDFGGQFMSRIMQHLKPKKQDVTIMVATSGDTGSAIGEAFRGVEGFNVFILYAKNGISPMQKEHMDRIGRNVYAVAVDGTFDDCQAIVKKAFSDKELESLHLTTGNSINISRIIAQSVYYVYAYLQSGQDEVVFAVPSGNFGNSLACLYAKKMGVPIKKIVIGTNANDEVAQFFKTGEYKPLDHAKDCMSNAMNIGNPSNLARFFELYDGTVDKEGVVHKAPNLEKMKEDLFVVSISDDRTKETMSKYKDTSLLEPHGAVGVAATEDYRKEDPTTHVVCMETANPAKFTDKVEEVVGATPDIPKQLYDAIHREKQTTELPNDYEQVKQYMVSTCNK